MASPQNHLHPLKYCPDHMFKIKSPTIECSSQQKWGKVEREGKQLPFKEVTHKLPTSLLPVFYWKKPIHSATAGYKEAGKCSLWPESYVPSYNSGILLLEGKRKWILGDSCHLYHRQCIPKCIKETLVP